MTILEVLVAMVVTAVALAMVTRIVIAAAQQRAVNTENAIASNAARMALERLRNAPFEQCFALYNGWGADDPDGPGSAPGSAFAVEGLALLPDAEACGTLHFPAQVIVDEAGLSSVQLREDWVDRLLDLPRDLSGDSIVDDDDHAGDYLLLPVKVSVQWQGEWGPRVLEVHTLLTSFRK